MSMIKIVLQFAIHKSICWSAQSVGCGARWWWKNQSKSKMAGASCHLGERKDLNRSSANHNKASQLTVLQCHAFSKFTQVRTAKCCKYWCSGLNAIGNICENKWKQLSDFPFISVNNSCEEPSIIGQWASSYVFFFRLIYKYRCGTQVPKASIIKHLFSNRENSFPKRKS